MSGQEDISHFPPFSGSFFFPDLSVFGIPGAMGINIGMHFPFTVDNSQLLILINFNFYESLN